MRFLHILWKLALAFTILCLFILALLPSILSSNWGKEQLASMLSISTKSSVKIGQVQLAWFKPQSIENISLSSPEYSLDVQSIELKNSLWSFVFSGFSFNDIEIHQPQYRIYKVEQKPEANGSGAFPLLFVKQLKLTQGVFALVSKDEQLIQFENINLNAHIARSERKIHLKLGALSRYQKQNGSIDLTAYIDTKQSPPQFELNANIVDLPLEGIDQIAFATKLYDQPLLTHSFGNTMNVRLHLNSKTNKMEANIKSRHLNLNLNTKNTSSPLVFNWTVNPDLLHLFNETAIKKPFSISTSVQSLHLPSLQDWKQSQFTLRTVLSQLEVDTLLVDRLELQLSSQNLSQQLRIHAGTSFASPYASGILEMDGFIQTLFEKPKIKFSLKSNNIAFNEPLSQLKRRIDQFHCTIDNQSDHPFNATFSVEDVAGPSLLGNNIHGQWMAHYRLGHGVWKFDDFNLKVDSTTMKAHFKGDFDVNNVALKLSKDGFIDYKLSPPLFKLLARNLPFPLFLKKDTSISLIFEKSSSIDQIDANLFSEDFTVSLVNPKQDFEFRNFDSHLQIQTKKNNVLLTAHMNIKNAGNVRLKASQDLDSQLTKLSLQGDQIPSNLFSPWLKINAPLNSLIGENIDFDIQALGKHQALRSLDLTIKSDYINAKGGLAFDSEQRLEEVTSPLQIQYTMTPQSYAILSALENNSSRKIFQLKQPASITAKLTKFRIEPHLGFPSSQLRGEFNLENFIAASDHLEAKITKLNCSIQKKKFENAMATLASTITSEGENAHIEGSLEVKNINTDSHWLQMLGGVHLDSKLTIAKLPTAILDALAQPIAAFPFSAILGKRLNADLDITMQESIKKVAVDIDSTDSKLSLKGTALTDKFILNEPVQGSLKLTPSLSHLLFDNLGLSIEKSGLPITLVISDKGFFLPLTGNVLLGTRVGLAIVDPGQIVAINQGTLSTMNSIFKIQGSHAMQVWFAPFYLGFQRGILDIARTDFLVDRKLHVCLWGQIDYEKEYVNLTLGLTAQALRSTLNVQGIPDSYVLKVPLTGPFGDVKLQKGAIGAKLALLLGDQASSNRSIFGGIVSVFNQIMNDQSDVPPPRRPFPWEKETSQVDENEAKPILQLKEHKIRDQELLSAPIPVHLFLPVEPENELIQDSESE